MGVTLVVHTMTAKTSRPQCVLVELLLREARMSCEAGSPDGGPGPGQDISLSE